MALVTFIDFEDGVCKEHLKARLNGSTCVQHFVEPNVRSVLTGRSTLVKVQKMLKAC